jgi:colanic acid biosynthesis glycosyl transferase WcaI
MVERAQAKGVAPSQTILFPNWVNVDEICPLNRDAPNSFRKELGLEGKIILLYSGNMGAKQGLELLAPLAEDFGPGGHDEDPRVHFIFCGDGAYRPQLEVLVAHHSNVTMLPLQPYLRLNDLLNAADIHLLPQRAGAADLVMPSKLTGMLSSGRPVLATAEPDTQVGHVVGGYTEEDACGVIVPAEDPDALHAAVKRLVNDPELRQRLGVNARRYAVEHLGREQVLQRFQHDLNELL